MEKLDVEQGKVRIEDVLDACFFFFQNSICRRRLSAKNGITVGKATERYDIVVIDDHASGSSTVFRQAAEEPN